MVRFPHRPSPAMVVALVALVTALAGTAYATSRLNGHNLANRSVPGKKLQRHTITGAELAAGRLDKGSIAGDKLKSHSVTVGQVNESSLSDIVPKAIPITYVSSAEAIPPGAGGEIGVAICPSSTPDVIGGGAELSDNTNALVTSSYPNHNTWSVIAFASVPNVKLTTTAVCTNASP